MFDPAMGALVIGYLFAGFWWIVLSFAAIIMRFVPDQYSNGRFLSRATLALSVGFFAMMLVVGGLHMTALGWVILTAPVSTSLVARLLFLRRRTARGFPVIPTGVDRSATDSQS